MRPPRRFPTVMPFVAPESTKTTNAVAHPVPARRSITHPSSDWLYVNRLSMHPTQPADTAGCHQQGRLSHHQQRQQLDRNVSFNRSLDCASIRPTPSRRRRTRQWICRPAVPTRGFWDSHRFRCPVPPPILRAWWGRVELATDARPGAYASVSQRHQYTGTDGSTPRLMVARHGLPAVFISFVRTGLV